MNSRERVLCALDHKEPDRIPLDLGAGKCCKFHVFFYQRLLDHLGLKEEVAVCDKFNQSAFASDALLERLECDVRTPFPTTLPRPGYRAEEYEDDAYKYYRDEWGTLMRMPKDELLYYDMYKFPLVDAEEKDDASYAWPDPPPFNPAGVDQARAYRAAGYPVDWVENYANGFLQTGPRLYSFDNWLPMLALEEDRVRNILDRLLEVKIRYWDNLLDLYGDALDIVSEMDDLGTQNAPFVSPDMFRELFKPYWVKLFGHIRKRTGARILLHTCGAVEPLLGDLIEAGLEIVNPVQISAAGMDPVHLKKKFGKDLSFWGGGLDTQKVLPKGTRDEIRDGVKRSIDALAKDGGFVFCPVHNIQADVPVENFMIMWEAYMENRDY